MPARSWLVAAGAFAVGTSAYVVSGVLPAVSRDLDVTLTAAGQLTTAFALSYAIGCPILASLTGRCSSRRWSWRPSAASSPYWRRTTPP